MRLLRRLDTSRTQAVVVQYFFNDFRENREFLEEDYLVKTTSEEEFKQRVYFWLYPDFPKGINTMYPYILRGKLSVRPAQVGGIDVNTLLSKLSWLLRIPNVDRILPLDRGATVR